MKQKLSGTLKQFIDVKKKDTRLIGSIERYLLSKPKDTSRRTDVLHPSEMCSSDWCHRASYFLLKGHSQSYERKTSFTLLSVFEEGHMIHAKWQRWIQEMGALYGKWYCHDCGEMFWGGSDCHEGPLEYKEVPLFYEPLRIFGHADGLIVNVGEPLLLEIKSIGEGTLRWEAPELLMEYNNDFKAAWNSLTQPFMKHIMQAQIYMKLAELLNLDVQPQEAVFIYESKPTQQAKEFVVPKSDFGIEHLFEAAASIVEAVKNNTPIECNISSDGCPRCRGFKDA
jgi:hypothetical protein